MKNKPSIQIELTDEQRRAIQQASGKRLAAVELTPERLEERLAPGQGVN